MKLPIAMFIFCVMPFSLLAIEDSKNIVRAPRPDALSYPGSTPAIVSPFDTAQLAQIQQCVCQLKSIIESDLDVVESQLDVVISQLDSLNVCGPTSITETGDIIISTPGSYCLANDVMSITITTSLVTLNMSGHIAGSLIISPIGKSSIVGGISHIIVENGFIFNSPLVPGISVAIDLADAVTISNLQIDSDLSAPAKNTGVDIKSSGDVIINNVSISNAGTGINLHSLDSLFIDQSSIISSSSSGLFIRLPNTSFVVVENTVIDSSGINGIDVQGSTLSVKNCQILNSATYGLHAQAGGYFEIENVLVNRGQSCFQWDDGVDSVQMTNCSALNYRFEGISMEDNKGIAVLRGCFAQTDLTPSFPFIQSGFHINLKASAVMYGCETYNNQGYGFFLESSKSAVLYNCNAFFNTNLGFYIFSPTVNGVTKFYNCDAASNGGDGFFMDGTVCEFYNCSALSNAQHGFNVSFGSGVVYNCGATSNGGNGFSLSGSSTKGVCQNCFAVNNSGYGFFNDATAVNMAYAGNAAVGNTLGEYNAAKDKAPFYWVFAKDTAATAFRDVVLAAILG